MTKTLQTQQLSYRLHEEKTAKISNDFAFIGKLLLLYESPPTNIEFPSHSPFSRTQNTNTTSDWTTIVALEFEIEHDHDHHNYKSSEQPQPRTEGSPRQSERATTTTN